MNRLCHETSPYLLQHALNPVDWHPWGPEALEKAKAQQKPILVSIGYAACHWCHVMERESFENEETAAIMNSNFINIKIDREERPDLDAIYMDAVQTISGSGGWPLNVFLTPEAMPFFGGTYYPNVSAYNRPSWNELLTSLVEAWKNKKHELIAQAQNLTHHLQKANLISDGKMDANGFSENDLKQMEASLLKTADKEWGGFGKAPKFPQTFSIQFLLRQHYYQSKKELQFNFEKEIENAEAAGLKQALLSLDKMMGGGLYDQLQGGISRYSTDARWLAPHFEKMLYDNALFVSTLSEAYQLTNNPLYAKTIKQTMHFISQEWQATNGGFYAAYDADSEGIEGKYYTWSKQEIEQILGSDAEIFCNYYSITEHGNWEEVNILWVHHPLEQFCATHALPVIETEIILEKCRQILLGKRSSRIKPLLDDKILMGWNALMITACCKAFAALQNPQYIAMAEKCYHFIESHLKNDADTFFHNYKKVAANPAFLDDYAFYIQSLIHLQEVTGNHTYLQKAKQYTQTVLVDFADDQSPFFFYTPSWQQDVIIRKKDIYDGAVPSGNSIMASNLLYLATIFYLPEWKTRATSMLSAVSALIIKYPNSFGIWAHLFQQLVYGNVEIVISGKQLKEKLYAILKKYCPNKVLQSTDRPNNTYPLLQDKWMNDEETWIYVCKNYACLKPTLNII